MRVQTRNIITDCTQRNFPRENRKRCLQDLKEIGYQVGCGFMVGSPGQTIDTLYEDLQFIRRLRTADDRHRTIYTAAGYTVCRRNGRNSETDSKAAFYYTADPPARIASGNDRTGNH